VKNILVITGGCIVVFMAIFAVFADVIAPFDPATTNIRESLMPPSLTHIMGTDQLGRDVFSRMLHGSRISLLVGFVAVGLSTFIGLIMGALAGFYGGRTETTIMRFVDIMLCFPSFFLILAVIAFLEPSIINIMVVIGLTSWMGIARLVRAEFLKLKNQDFILAAQIQGVSDLRLMTKYMLPNAMAPLFVTFTLGVAGAILIESSLSFLGIGVQPPTPSWGNILIDGKAALEVAWWLSVFPGLAILITVLGYNLLGEGLRDVLDPRLQNQ
tara:strand:+ start:83508 stop:84317 length:810 start_codon:yes stop_codon:yes gene_type:complete